MQYILGFLAEKKNKTKTTKKQQKKCPLLNP